MFFMRFVFNSRTPQKAQYDNLREKRIRQNSKASDEKREKWYRKAQLRQKKRQQSSLRLRKSERERERHGGCCVIIIAA